MPQYQQGDMWSVWESADLFVITTNSTLRTDGALVMGRGIARQARNRFPGLATILGKTIATTYGSGDVYGLLVSPSWPTAKLAAFQVKTDWHTVADTELIQRSAAMLANWCAAHPDSRVHLNMPGIGNGKLSRDVVKPIVDSLPDTVTIWEYATTSPVAAPIPHVDTILPGELSRLTGIPTMTSPGFVLDVWDSEAVKEAYAQFSAAAGNAPLATAAADLDSAIFTAGFASGCAWMQARTQALRHNKEHGHALAG